MLGALLAISAAASLALVRSTATPTSISTAPARSQILHSLERHPVGIEGRRMDLQAILATPE